jgi:hypothetical protein
MPSVKSRENWDLQDVGENMCSSYEHDVLTWISDPDIMILLMQLRVLHVTPPTDTLQITLRSHHHTSLALAANFNTR